MPSANRKADIQDQGNQEADSDKIVTIDRRRPKTERRAGDPDALDVGVMENPRRKKQRRRHIDPTTCERDYTDPEIEFMRAMDDYKRRSGRMFPTCSEVLEVIRDLGYVRLTDDQISQLGLDGEDEFVDDEQTVDADQLLEAEESEA